MAHIGQGAVNKIVGEMAGGLTAPDDNQYTMSATATTLIAPYDIERVQLTVINTSPVPVTLAPRSEITAGVGIVLPPNGGAMILKVRDDAHLVSNSWYGLGSIGNELLYVLAVRRDTVPAEE